jgi:hypothetical protein
MRNAYKILVGKHEWKRPLGRFRGGYVNNNNKMDLGETELMRNGFMWLRIRNIGRLLNMVMNLQFL